MDHFEYNDEMFYDFRDPNESDGDRECEAEAETDDASADLDVLDAALDAAIETGLLTKDEFDGTYHAGTSRESIAKDPGQFPYVQAVELERCLQLGLMALLEKEQEGWGMSSQLEGTTSGPGSTSQVDDAEEKLQKDLRSVMLHLIRQKDALKAGIQLQTHVARGGAATFSGPPSDVCKVSYQADLDGAKEKVQKGTTDEAHQGQDLETSETRGSAVTGELQETKKEYILDPAEGTDHLQVLVSQGMKDSGHKEEITTETIVNAVTELLDDTEEFEAFGYQNMRMLDLLQLGLRSKNESVQSPQETVDRHSEIQIEESDHGQEEITDFRKQAFTGHFRETERKRQEEPADLSTDTEDADAKLDLETSVKEMTNIELIEESTAESHRKAVTGPRAPEKTLEPAAAVSTLQASVANVEHEEEKSTVTHPFTPLSTAPSEGCSSRSIEVTTNTLRLRKMRSRLIVSKANDAVLCICGMCGCEQHTRIQEYTCLICSDESRNFSLLDQSWLSNDELEIMNLKNAFQILEPGLSAQIYTLSADFKISRAIFLRLPHGNILWDCISYVDEETVVEFAKVGGIQAIVISSPDKMGACVRLSYIFNRCPILVHKKDKKFYPVPVLDTATFWDGQTSRVWDGATIIRLGGHYDGSCILHLDRKGGIVFSSNTLKVLVGETESVSVMKSYNNYIPAHPKDVRQILGIMEEWDFDELWGDEPGEQILERAKSVVIFSLNRYIRWSQHDEDALEFETRPLSRREIIARGKRKVDEV